MSPLFEAPVIPTRAKRPIGVYEDDPSPEPKRVSTQPCYESQGDVEYAGPNSTLLLNNVGDNGLDHMKAPQQNIKRDGNPLLSSSERDFDTAMLPIIGPISDYDTSVAYLYHFDATTNNLQDEQYVSSGFESRMCRAKPDFPWDITSVSHPLRNGLLHSDPNLSSLVTQLR